MEDKIITFTKAIDAAAKLNNAIAALDDALDNKQKKLAEMNKNHQNEVKLKEKQIISLKASSQKALKSMDIIINKLNLVLEKDGSGNNNS